jgi:hypothetical protein
LFSIKNLITDFTDLHGLKKRKKVYQGIQAQSGGAAGFLRLSVAGHRIKFSKSVLSRQLSAFSHQQKYKRHDKS